MAVVVFGPSLFLGPSQSAKLPEPSSDESHLQAKDNDSIHEHKSMTINSNRVSCAMKAWIQGGFQQVVPHNHIERIAPGTKPRPR